MWRTEASCLPSASGGGVETIVEKRARSKKALPDEHALGDGVELDALAAAAEDLFERGGCLSARALLARTSRGHISPEIARSTSPGNSWPSTLCGLSKTLRVANGVSLRVSNPHLRLGPCTPLWLPDERVESIER